MEGRLESEYAIISVLYPATHQTHDVEAFLESSVLYTTIIALLVFFLEYIVLEYVIAVLLTISLTGGEAVDHMTYPGAF